MKRNTHTHTQRTRFYEIEKSDEKYEGGMSTRDLTAVYCMPRTTISTFMKNKDIIKFVNVAEGLNQF